MKHVEGVYPFNGAEYLVQKRLNVFGCQILGRHDEFVQVGINVYRKGKARNEFDSKGTECKVCSKSYIQTPSTDR
jgi:hypothetical protein